MKPAYLKLCWYILFWNILPTQFSVKASPLALLPFLLRKLVSIAAWYIFLLNILPTQPSVSATQTFPTPHAQRTIVASLSIIYPFIHCKLIHFLLNINKNMLWHFFYKLCCCVHQPVCYVCVQFERMCRPVRRGHRLCPRPKSAWAFKEEITWL